MLLVPCPHCGPRNASDLAYVGEARRRPDPAATSPSQWREYLYLRSNPAGLLRETWYCRAGCGRYFVVERDTVSNTFSAPPVPGRKTGRGA
ncbi:MAG TPA: sarcosine oxidase subunit delta [Ornithinimicrobium sp.]|uniref:sarcosine oxidase subunit delta n=1 Tax=Ornithinimicrobium sp. TaxID=1977084 RepID=UPI002B489ACF|nr:sarcosine oxidase subunit delta [Ornithinimicrobium sp.]HKJ12574.1 sarcosine oxidase subunit delta [Ornithinimicrobium sp.]